MPAEIGDLNPVDASNTARFPEGMAPSAINDSARALEGMIARYRIDTAGSLIATGSSNAYAVAAQQTLTALYDGLIVAFEANHTNTGAATLNVDSLGAKPIVWPNGAELGAGEIVAGAKIWTVYKSDVAKWQLQTVVKPPAYTADAVANTPAGNIAALTVQSAINELDTEKAPVTRTITGQHSIVTGGDLSADRTFSLVNDSASPGNNKAYGTDASGTRGFQPLPSITALADRTLSSSAEWTGLADTVIDIAVVIDGVSLSGTDNVVMQLGAAGAYQTSGYTCWNQRTDASGTGTSTSHFILAKDSAAGDAWSMQVRLTKATGNTWLMSGLYYGGGSKVGSFSGKVTLAGALDRIKIMAAGTNTIDAGTAAGVVMRP